MFACLVNKDSHKNLDNSVVGKVVESRRCPDTRQGAVVSDMSTAPPLHLRLQRSKLWAVSQLYTSFTSKSPAPDSSSMDFNFPRYQILSNNWHIDKKETRPCNCILDFLVQLITIHRWLASAYVFSKFGVIGPPSLRDWGYNFALWKTCWEKLLNHQ